MNTLSREVDKPALKGIFWVSCLAILLGLEVLILIGVAVSFIPMRSAFVTEIFPAYLVHLKPERENELYRFFVFWVMTLQGIFLWTGRRLYVKESFQKLIKRFIAIDAGPVLIIIVMLSLIACHENSGIDKKFFGVMLAWFVVSKMVWFGLFWAWKRSPDGK